MVLLEYYHLQKDFEGSISLQPDGALPPIQGQVKSSKEEEKDTIENLIESLNEQFGTHFSEMNKVLKETREIIQQDKKAENFAKENTEMTFDRIYKDAFSQLLQIYQQGQDKFDVLDRMMSDIDFMNTVRDSMRHDVYESLRE